MYVFTGVPVYVCTCLLLHPCPDGPILQAIQYFLHQALFPCTEQVGIDIRQEERGGNDLPTTAGNQFREDGLDGRDSIRLNAGNPMGTHVLPGKTLADEQEIGLSHVAQQLRCGDLRVDKGHFYRHVEQEIRVGRVFARLGIRRDADDDRVDPRGRGKSGFLQEPQ